MLMLYHMTEAERGHTNRVNKKIWNRRNYPYIKNTLQQDVSLQ